MGRKAQFKGFDVSLNTLWSTEDMLRCAKLSEKYGADTFWIAEQYHNRSAMPALTLMAANTKRIKVGTGIISPFTRHPALIAMESATLDEISKGRFVLGLGAARFSLLRHGDINIKAYTGIKESIEIIRALIQGRKVTYEGEVFKLSPPGTVLGFKPLRSRIPIHIGAMSRRLFKLAGETADGLLLGNFTSPSLVRCARENLAEGAHMRGRNTSNIPLRADIEFSVDRDPAAAREHIRPTIASYLSENLEFFRFGHAGFKEEEFRNLQKEIRKRLKVWGAGDMEEAAKCVSDEVVDRLVVAGTPDECVEKLQKLAQAGLDYPIIYQVLGKNIEQGLGLLVEKVLPHLLPDKR